MRQLTQTNKKPTVAGSIALLCLAVWMVSPILLGVYVIKLKADLKAEREKEGANSPFVFITRDGNQIGVNTLREWCTRIGKAIGVETLHPHDFRHSSATLRKNAGMTLEDVSSFLQHGSTDITKRYYLKEDKSQLSNTFKSIKI